jgi:acetylornithine deacetylase/succinyl-diaminopimelate desuccinylase-like protein
MTLKISDERFNELRNYSDSLRDLFVEEVTTVCEIPAPSYSELDRAKYVEKRMSEYGFETNIDDQYNVIAFKKGNSKSKPRLMLAAHTDTVFPLGTDVAVTRKGNQLFAPGIRDNSAGVAGIILLAKALSELDVEHNDIFLVGTSCEEGLGDLNGMKVAFKSLKDKVDYVIAVDGNLGGIIHGGIGSRRLKVKVSTEGGHSWGAFGVASAIHSLGKMIAKISEIEVPMDPKTSYNVGVIEGGTSINTIAAKASMLIDMRSIAKEPLIEVEDKVRAIIEKIGLEDQVNTNIEVVGDRPVGYLERNHELVKAAISVLESLNLPTDGSSSSTDANIPLSYGVPAICLGITSGKYAHREDEILDIDPATTGILQLLLMLEQL